MIDKFVADPSQAVADIRDGAVILLGGFGVVGQPDVLVDALVDQGARDLTFVCNSAGRDRWGLAQLIGMGRVRKLICSFPGGRRAFIFEEVYAAGKIELEIVPQGTLAERLRAAGAGIPAFYTPTAADTELAEGKEVREFDGRRHVMERALRGDVALVQAWRADRWGNLTYRSSGRNFNPIMAMAGRLTIVQTRHVAQLGELDPEAVATPGVVVDRIVHVPDVDPREDPEDELSWRGA